jgi:hypothetical protein
MTKAFLSALAIAGAFALAAPPAGARSTAASRTDLLAKHVNGPRRNVLAAALRALECASQQGLVPNDRLLTVIDFSLPSTEPRLWVLDLATPQVLYRELVSHGKNSGENVTARFSNAVGSLQTSLGLFVTEGSYVGQNGYSLRLNGLEPGFNDNASARAIVMHGASYVSEAIGRELGRLGRSWGCPAVRSAVARPLIDTIKGGTAVFAYGEDSRWLANSSFVSRCGSTAHSAVAASPQ